MPITIEEQTPSVAFDDFIKNAQEDLSFEYVTDFLSYLGEMLPKIKEIAEIDKQVIVQDDLEEDGFQDDDILNTPGNVIQQELDYNELLFDQLNDLKVELTVATALMSLNDDDPKLVKSIATTLISSEKTLNEQEAIIIALRQDLLSQQEKITLLEKESSQKKFQTDRDIINENSIQQQLEEEIRNHKKKLFDIQKHLNDFFGAEQELGRDLYDLVVNIMSTVDDSNFDKVQKSFLSQFKTWIDDYDFLKENQQLNFDKLQSSQKKIQELADDYNKVTEELRLLKEDKLNDDTMIEDIWSRISTLPGFNINPYFEIENVLERINGGLNYIINNYASNKSELDDFIVRNIDLKRKYNETVAEVGLLKKELELELQQQDVRNQRQNATVNDLQRQLSEIKKFTEESLRDMSYPSTVEGMSKMKDDINSLIVKAAALENDNASLEEKNAELQFLYNEAMRVADTTQLDFETVSEKIIELDKQKNIFLQQIESFDPSRVDQLYDVANRYKTIIEKVSADYENSYSQLAKRYADILDRKTQSRVSAPFGGDSIGQLLQKTGIDFENGVKFKNLTDQLSALREEKNKLEQELATSCKQIGVLQENCSSEQCKERLEAYRSDISRLNEELELLRNSQEKLKNDLRDLNAMIINLRSENDSLEERLTNEQNQTEQKQLKFQQDIQSKNESIASIQAELNQGLDERSRLMSQLGDNNLLYKRELLNKNNDIKRLTDAENNLKNRLSELEKTLDQLNNQNKEYMDARNSNSDALKNLTLENADNRNKNIELTRQISSLQQEIDNAKAVVDEKKKEISGLNAQLESMRDGESEKTRQLYFQISELKRELVTINQEKLVWSSKIDKLTSQLTESQEANKILSNRNTEFLKVRDTDADVLVKMNLENNELTNKITFLQQEIEKAKGRANDKEREISNLTAQLNSLKDSGEKETRKRDSKLSQLEKELATINQEKADWEKKSASATTLMGKLTRQLEELKETNNILENRLKEASAVSYSIQQKSDNLTKDIEDKNRLVDSLKQQILNLNSDKSLIKKQFDDYRESRSTVENQLRNSISRLEADLNDKNNTLLTLQKEFGEYKDKQATITLIDQTENQRLEKENRLNSDQITSLKEELQQIGTQNSQYENAILNLKTANSKLMEKLKGKEESDKHVGTLKSEVLELKKLLSDSADAITNLKFINDRLQSYLQNEKTTAQSLGKVNDDYLAKIRILEGKLKIKEESVSTLRTDIARMNELLKENNLAYELNEDDWSKKKKQLESWLAQSNATIESSNKIIEDNELLIKQLRENGDNKAADLQKKITELQKKIASNEKLMTTQSNENMKLKEINNKAATDFQLESDRRATINKQLSESIRALKSDNDDLKDELSKVDQKFEQLNASSVANKKEYDQKVKQLESSLTTADESLKKIQQTQFEFKETFKVYMQPLSNLVNEEASRLRDPDKFKAINTNDPDMKSFQDAVFKLNEMKLKTKTTIQSLKDAYANNMKILELQISDNLKTINEQKDQLAKSIQDKNNDLKIINKLKANLDATELKLEQQQQSVSSVEKDLKDKQHEMDELKRKYLNLKGERKECVDKTVLLNKQIATLKQLNAEQKKELGDVNHSLRIHTKTLEEATVRTTKYKEAVETYLIAEENLRKWAVGLGLQPFDPFSRQQADYVNKIKQAVKRKYQKEVLDTEDVAKFKRLSHEMGIPPKEPFSLDYFLQQAYKKVKRSNT